MSINILVTGVFSMRTSIITNLSCLDEAASILQAGGLVAAPTETVYGLCANALDPEAVKKIYIAKGRPSDNPLIVHIADLDMLAPLVSEVSDTAKLLISHFWPGPMTLVFKASDLVPKSVTGGLDTVAVRFPAHPVIQDLIKTSKLPLAAPSANTSGKPSPTNAARVIEDLNGKIDAILVGDDSKYGVESTVIDTTSPTATILRPGGITEEMLQDVLNQVTVDPALGHALKPNETPKAPGMKYAHYAPNAEVIIVEGQIEAVIERINELVQDGKEKGKKVGILATDETQTMFKGDLVISAGTSHDLTSIAAHLFEALRSFDDAHIDTVYTLAFPKEGIGSAIMNRLEKAAAYHIIRV